MYNFANTMNTIQSQSHLVCVCTTKSRVLFPKLHDLVQASTAAAAFYFKPWWECCTDKCKWYICWQSGMVVHTMFAMLRCAGLLTAVLCTFCTFSAFVCCRLFVVVHHFVIENCARRTTYIRFASIKCRLLCRLGWRGNAAYARWKTWEPQNELRV